MKQVIYRQNKMFVIDKDLIKAEPGQKDQICNALYAAVYSEFAGAIKNPAYKNQTNLERINSLNQFAYDWLNSRGLI